MFFGERIFNFIGGSFRWMYGSLWRTLLNRKKYSFSEYINGPNDTDDIFDQLGNNMINKVLGIIIIVLVCWILIRLEL